MSARPPPPSRRTWDRRSSAYLERLESRLRDEGLAHPLLVMQASGGLTSVTDAAARPIVTLDSGPTGGILGSRELGRSTVSAT